MTAPPLPWKSGAYLASSDPQKHRDFGTWRGYDIGMVMAFSGFTDWAALENPTSLDWIVGTEWQFGHKAILVTRFHPSNGFDATSTYAQVASGANDAHIVALATNLINKGLTDIILCPYHEFNLNGSSVSINPGGVGDQSADMRDALRHAITVMRGVSVGGVSGNWEWMLNPSNGTTAGKPNPTSVYPGDNYVDHWWPDFYDRWDAHISTEAGGTTTDAQRWSQILTGGGGGLTANAAFCRAGATRNANTGTGTTTATKELGFGGRETGMWDTITSSEGGGGDNSAYFRNWFAFLKAHHAAGGTVSGEVLFNNDGGDGKKHQIWPTTAGDPTYGDAAGFAYPLATVAYRAALTDTADRFSELFEGTNGAAITGGAASNISIANSQILGAGTVQFDTSYSPEGSSSAHFVANAQSASLENVDTGDTETKRFYSIKGRINSISSTLVLHSVRASAATRTALISINSNGTVKLANQNGTSIGTTANAIPTNGESFRIDWSIDGNNVKLELYPGDANCDKPVGTAAALDTITGTISAPANPLQYQVFGATSSSTADFNIDYFRAGSTALPGPLSTPVSVAPAATAAVVAIPAPVIILNPVVQAVAAVAAVPAPTLNTTSINGMVGKQQPVTSATSGTAQVASLASAAFSQTPTAGNLLLMAVVSENTVTTPAGWTLAKSAVGTVATYLFYKIAGGAEASSWTVTPTAASAMCVVTAEYFGVQASGALDQTSSHTNTGTALSTGVASQTASAELVIAVFGSGGTSTTGIGNPDGGFGEQQDVHTTRTSGLNVDLSFATTRISTSGDTSSNATAAGTVTGGASVQAGFRLDLSNTEPHPDTVTAVVAVGTPSITSGGDTTVGAEAVVSVADVPAPTIPQAPQALVPPAVVQAAVTIPSVSARVVTNSVLAVDVVPAVTDVPAPTTIGSGVSVTTVTAVEVVSVVAVPAPTIDIGQTATAVGEVAAVVAAVPTPLIDLGTATTVTPATVPVSVGIGGAAISSATVAVFAVTVETTVTIGDVTVVTTSPLFLFRTPVRRAGARYTTDATPEQKALYRHVPQDGPGVAVLITGGVVTEKAVPTQTELEAADAYFLGGYENQIDSDTADILTAAGYDVLAVNA